MPDLQVVNNFIACERSLTHLVRVLLPESHRLTASISVLLSGVWLFFTGISVSFCSMKNRQD